VDVQLDNTKAAPPFSFVDDWFFNHHCHFKCVCLRNEEEKKNTCELSVWFYFLCLGATPPSHTSWQRTNMPPPIFLSNGKQKSSAFSSPKKNEAEGISNFCYTLLPDLQLQVTKGTGTAITHSKLAFGTTPVGHSSASNSLRNFPSVQVRLS
jgi:hypothetical protein